MRACSDISSLLSRLHEKKQQLDAFGLLPQSLQANLRAWYKISLTYSSNALEGNTLSMQETACVVDEGLSIAGKTVVEHLEAISHAKAVDAIQELARTKKRSELTADDILNVHRIVLQSINAVDAGHWRTVMVRISGSQVPRPNHLKVAQLMEEFIAWLRTATGPIAQIAADAHLKFVFIHPFVDGNGRTARLLMNLLLQQEGYPLTVIEKEERAAYLMAVEKALRFEDLTDFYQLVFHAIERSLDAYIEAASESKLA